MNCSNIAMLFLLLYIAATVTNNLVATNPSYLLTVLDSFHAMQN